MIIKLPLVDALSHLTEPVPLNDAADLLSLSTPELDDLLAEEGIAMETTDGQRTIGAHKLRQFVSRHRADTMEENA